MNNEKSLRERIVVCSYEMFSSRGIRSVTMDAISAELSISKRTLYEEFSSKNELLNCVLYEMNRYFQTQNDRISEMDISAMEKIFMITSINGERSSREALFFQDIVANYPQLLDKLVKANYDNNYKRVMKNIEQGCREGYFCDRIDFKIAIDFFFEVKTQINFRKNIQRMNMYNTHILSTVFFLRSIATEKGIAEIDRLCEKNNINIYKKGV